MKDINYTTEEKELAQYMETNPKSVPNVKDRIAFIKQSVKHNVTAKKQVNFRINENDLERLKTKALVEGIPYQTLLNSIVHKFLNGTLVYKN
ncbi:MAG: antitoxin [Campylobacterota bacterium]|nr:antitoxin [Campylobacterota bacterium]